MLSKSLSGLVSYSNWMALFQNKNRQVATTVRLLGFHRRAPTLPSTVVPSWSSKVTALQPSPQSAAQLQTILLHRERQETSPGMHLISDPITEMPFSHPSPTWHSDPLLFNKMSCVHSCQKYFLIWSRLWALLICSCWVLVFFCLWILHGYTVGTCIISKDDLLKVTIDYIIKWE